MTENNLKLKIDAHVIRQLGAELITSPLVAITELIKNSHDADASWCNLEIDPTFIEQIEVDPNLYPNDKTLIKRDNKIFKEFLGKITVFDNGCGMGRETIDKSWLTVSYSDKRNKKKEGEKTSEYKRNYTGDKGLGRLGSMQVASICKITSSKFASEQSIQVSINWDQLIEGITIDQIQIDETSFKKTNPKEKGTKIELIGLHDHNFWQSDLTAFKYQLTTNISPFGYFSKRKDAFKLYIKINGIEQSSEELTQNLLDLHSGFYRFSFDGKKLIVSGTSNLMSFESQNTRDRFPSYVLNDKGENLFAYFKKSKQLSTFSLHRSNQSKYFIEWEKLIDYDELFTQEKYKAAVLENPGAFDAEIFDFIYSRSHMGGGPEDIGFTRSKELIQEYLSGVKLYRDGFKIGSGREDLFNMGYEKTGGDGAYSLRPSNIAGHIDIAWDKNPNLLDTSNRERLLENPAQQAFYSICIRAIAEVNSFRDKSRRLTSEFLNEKKNEEYEKPAEYSPERALTDLAQLSQHAVKIHKNIKEQKIETDRRFNTSSLALTQKIQESESLFTDPQQLKVLSDLKDQLIELQNLYKSLESPVIRAAHDLASSEAMIGSIKSKVDSYEEQVTRFYGHVSIGLSAQFLAHDVNSQISNITRANHNIKNRLKAINLKDMDITKATMSIDGHTQALSKAVSALHPLVQAQREEKHSFGIDEGIESYIRYISEYLEVDNIQIQFHATSSKQINFNHGKFYQVIDNIIRNSQYWLNSFGKHHPNLEKRIYVDLQDYEVTIWDTGKGIRLGMESSMFDMFVTEKPDGQGLGLFIVRTLLNERKCSIYLLDDINAHNRKYKLQIDFSGAAL